MPAVPERNFSTVAMIDQYHEHERAMEKPRPYFQISMIGHHCDRFLWLTFRWAVFEPFPGRILRLFRRGQREEDTVAQDLINIGCDLRNYGTNQMTLSPGGHLKGHPDGIIKKGLPEAPLTEHLLEIKTHSLKSFAELQSKGLELAKPMHLAQMLVYMYLAKIERGLYFAVCKDNDQIHTERVQIDYNKARALIERGHRISLLERIPEPITADPSWYKCQFCPAHDLCFGSRKTKEVNCRTCAHSTPLADGSWHCAYWKGMIPEYAQIDGCECHVLHPDLVPWSLDQDLSNEVTAVYEINGQKVRNGLDAYASEELLTYDGPFNDPVVDTARGIFKGRLINATCSGKE